MSFSYDYFDYVSNKYPLINSYHPEKLKSNFGELLISPYLIQLPQAALTQAQKLIQVLFKIRNSQEYQKLLSPSFKNHDLVDPGNHSILMSYDFHWSDNQLKLIEVNTNASFLILGYEMYAFTNSPRPVSDFQISDLIQNIQNELSLQNKKITRPKIAIVDHQPLEQKLFIEFIVYKNFLEQHGLNCDILNVADLEQANPYDFIYNRSTDFYLTNPDSAWLRQQYLNKALCVSPNPNEYFLLADKARIIDWSKDEFLNQLSLSEEETETLKHSIPQTFNLDLHTKDWLWEKRKNFFFKPKNSFGSKSTYAGRGLSNIKFNELLNGETLAQQVIPAGKQNFDGQEFKFDLRFYAYENQVQMIMGRLYQGQLTNFKTPNGGWARIQIV